ncbi:hypothetical protein Tco_0670692 [Tanacetum coccineum]
MADQMDGEVRDVEHLNSEIKTCSGEKITICDDSIRGKKVYIHHHEALRDDNDVQSEMSNDSEYDELIEFDYYGGGNCHSGPRTEFGRDTSRLDYYFRVSPLEVSYDLENDESDYYGGGSSHSGQQQSALTGNFDTSDLHLDDKRNVFPLLEFMEFLVLNVVISVVLNKCKLTNNEMVSVSDHASETLVVILECRKNGRSSSPGGRDIKRRKKHISPQKPEDDVCLSSDVGWLSSGVPSGSSIEFGRDINRLDYFAASPLNMLYDSGDDELIAPFGGGSSQSGQQQQSANSSVNLGTNNGNTAQARNNSTGSVTHQASAAVKKFFKESRCWGSQTKRIV